MDAKLVSVSPKGMRKVFPLSSPATTLGRQPGCDLQVPLEKISRQHCRVMVEGAKVSVKDLGSANGTFVNGQKITQQELKAGDIISLSDAVNFLIQIDGKPANIDESKLRPGAAKAAPAPTPTPTPAPAAKAPPAKAKPAAAAPTTAVKAPPKPQQEDEADDLLGESFFKDMDEDEDEK